MAEIKKINTELQILNKFLDTSGDAGTSQKILRSTGTGVDWFSGFSSVYTVGAVGSGAAWRNMGTFTAGQGGKSIFIKIVSNNGYNAGISQNYEVYIRFKTSNGSSTNANGFAADSSFYTTGANGSMAAGNIKWVADAAGASATTYTLYVLFAQFTGDGSFYVAENSTGTWVNSGTTATDPGVASSTVLIPQEQFRVGSTDFVVNGGGGDAYFANSNVGIGTSSPGYGLDISVDSGNILNLHRPNSSAAAASFLDFSFNTANATEAVYARIRSDVEVNTDSAQGGDLSFHTANAGTVGEVMRLTQEGNVGIGSIPPQSKLHIETGSGGTYNPNSNHDDVTIEGSGNIGLQLFSPNTTYQYIAFGDPDSVNAGYIRYHHGTNEMILRTNGGDQLRIDSSGNVGIGGNTPSYLLDVRDGTSSGAIARFSAVNPHVIIESSTAGNSVLHFKPNVTSSKSGQFKVTAGNGYNFKWTNDAAGTGETIYMDLDTSTTGGGDLTVKGDIIAYGAPSDRKYKENIKPIESALDKAMQLQGVTFDWKDSESILDIKEDIGFIAQDVEKVLPELVRDNGKGNLSLRYQGITPILLEAIKELKEEIEELKKQIK